VSYSGTKTRQTSLAAVRRILPLIDVTDPRFGAMGDGVSDDVGPFQSAISAAIAAGGSVVHAPSGKTYKLNSGLTLGSNVALELGDGAVLDFSGCAVGTVLIAATGLEGTATLLTANAPLGATSVAVVSASGLVAGDAVRIGSDKQFDSKNTHIPIGELNRRRTH
jgi:polygalacturonase